MRIARGVWALGLVLSSVAIAGASGRAGRPAAREQGSLAPVSFNREILPILSNNCFACHGPDEGKRETKFHFDTREGAFAKKGVIVPGNADGSFLIERVTNPDPDERMPPAETGHTLTASQIELLKGWIAQGAKWDPHWAFTPPARPELPPVSGAQARWVRNPIDRFILARLEREGLKPSPD